MCGILDTGYNLSSVLKNIKAISDNEIVTILLLLLNLTYADLIRQMLTCLKRD